MLPCLHASLFILVARKLSFLALFFYFLGTVSITSDWKHNIGSGPSIYLDVSLIFLLPFTEMQGLCGIKRLGVQGGLDSSLSELSR